MAARPPASTTNQPANTVSSSSSRSATASRISIAPTAPAGSITITQPPETSTSYFKLAPSNPITFAWNFTNVLVTPTHLTVSAACENGKTYPVGPTNGVIPGTATSVVWDIYSYQQNNPATPLAQAVYTLLVWDDRGTAAPRLPGFMVPNENVKFAIYTPADYQGIDDGESYPSRFSSALFFRLVCPSTAS